MKLTIIADDFTGSNDTGVQFAKRGLSTIVTTEIEKFSKSLLEREVLVVDTESRFDDQKAAYEKVHHVTKSLLGYGNSLVYKKIDSTFRGNIGAEIAACMDGAHSNFALMIPALPSNGRVTLEGNIYVHGKLLHETEIAQDPKTPVTKSYIPDIIGEQTDKRVAVVKKSEGIYTEESLLEKIAKAKNDGVEILVFDAETTDDLELLSTTIAKLPRDYILVGTAGLAEYLPSAYGLRNRKGILSIIGSVSDVTRGQVDYARKNNEVEIIHFTVEIMFDEELRKDVITDIIERLSKGEDVVLYTAASRQVIANTKAFAREKAMDDFAISDYIAKTLGEVTGIVMHKAKDNLAAIFITGGDTLIKIAKELSIHGMVILDEILPAIPLGKFVSDDFSDIKVVTKAGAFGTDETFSQILDYLRR